MRLQAMLDLGSSALGVRAKLGDIIGTGAALGECWQVQHSQHHQE
jgi:hypothetical protein